MFVRRLLTVTVSLSVGALVLGACTSDPEEKSAGDAPVVQLGGPGASNRELSEEELDELGTPGHTPADATFVQSMIPHHRQALEMTALVAARTSSRELGLLSKRMDVAQSDEIAQLEAWLRDRGEEVPAGGAHQHGPGHAALMPGMLTDGEMTRLTDSRGTTFERLFLQFMIRHHEGAVTMVDRLLTEGEGGHEPQVFQLAQHIDADQRVEIARMQSLLAQLT